GWPGRSWRRTSRIVPNCQCRGFQAGTGFEKIGSTLPNATASTAYVGTRNSRTSQIAPGSAKLGQRNRRVTVELAGLEGGPRVLPGRLPRCRERQQADGV